MTSLDSSARADSIGGTTMPSAFAAVRLITNSNLVDCATGRSAGFRILRGTVVNLTTAKMYLAYFATAACRPQR